MSRKFGEELTQTMLDSVLIIEDQVEFRGVIYYFQPNGSSCYLYEKKEHIYDASKVVCSPSKKMLKKYISWKSLESLK
jgi:hypothetical protein